MSTFSTTVVQPYLIFGGTCEAALELYQQR